MCCNELYNIALKDHVCYSLSLYHIPDGSSAEQCLDFWPQMITPLLM